MLLTLPNNFELAPNVLERLEECEKLIQEYPKLGKSFEHCITVLKNLAKNSDKTDGKVQLMMDFAPYSFTFRAGGLYGGMIFHGDMSGGSGYPTFSTQLNPSIGWSLHT